MGNVRVYEYVSDEGDVFYSFSKLGQRVSPPVRLILVDRLGTPSERFLTQMRRESISRAHQTDSGPDEV
mgnify:CR=1 FL=1|jgi:hypothetical protein